MGAPLGRLLLGMKNGKQAGILKENAKTGIMEGEGVLGVRDEIQLSEMPGRILVDLVANLRRNILQEMQMVGTIIRNRKVKGKWARLEMIADQMTGAKVASQMQGSQKNSESLREMHLEIVVHQMFLCEMLDLHEMLLKKMDGVLRKAVGEMLNQNHHAKRGLRTKEMIESPPLKIRRPRHTVGMPQPTDEMLADMKLPRKAGGKSIMHENPGSLKMRNGEKAAS